MGRIGGILKRCVALVALAVLAGCAAEFRNHGYAPSDSELAGIVVGRDTRESVAEAIGPPTAEGLRQQGAWYYVESRFRHFAWQAPKEIEREVVAISFGRNGRVSNIERFGLEDGRIVTLSRRVTKVPGAKKRPYLQRIFGSFLNR